MLFSYSDQCENARDFAQIRFAIENPYPHAGSYAADAAARIVSRARSARMCESPTCDACYTWPDGECIARRCDRCDAPCESRERCSREV